MSLQRPASRLAFLAGSALAVAAWHSSAFAAPCTATFGASFAASYSCNSLGNPTGIPAPLGGITFLNNSTLLIGGAANGAGGVIDQIGVVRGAGDHIVGFSGASSLFATAPQIDGGLSFGPGGVLFFTGYSSNQIGQIKPGSTSPDKTVTLPAASASVGSLGFVPSGFAGAGAFKVVSYNNGNWFTGTLTPDGTGTYNIGLTLNTTISGGPEGFVYVKGTNPGFGVDSVLISEYSAGRVRAYQINGSGDPIPATGQTFLSGLSGAEGAVIDPLTGDFLFSTFGGGNQVLVISGFAAPSPVPEPASLGLMAAGLLGLGLLRRRRA